MTGLELALGADVDEHHVATAEASEQLLASDRLDVLTEVLLSGAFDLRQTCRRDIAQAEPESKHVVPRERVAHTVSFAPTRNDSGCVQRLKVLGGVGVRLIASTRQFLDRPRPWARRSSSSSRRGLANALPSTAIASNKCVLRLARIHVAIQENN